MNEFDLDREVDDDVDREQEQYDEVHEAVIGPLSYHEFTAATLGLSRRLTHGDVDAAQDLINDVIEHLLDKSDMIAPNKAAAGKYVRRAMTHLYLDQWRAYNVRRGVLDTVEIDNALHVPVHQVPVEDQALRFESRAALAAAIDQLTPALRDIVRETYDVERGDFLAVERKVAAENLGILRNTADKRLSDAVKMLHDLLGPFWSGEDEDPTPPHDEEATPPHRSEAKQPKPRIGEEES